METRVAAKRKSINQSQNQSFKKKRIVLGELHNSSPNLNIPQTLKNPKPNKTTATTNKIASNAVDTDSSTDGKLEFRFDSDIFRYLHAMEMEKKRRPVINYMEKVQMDITPHMRGILVDWLVEVAEEYRLLSDTLHLAVSYIDRFLSVNIVNKPSLQLLGVSAVLIASKYEEINPCHVEKLCFITDNTYNNEEVLKMEADILKSLDFEMGNPTVKTFLRRFTGIGCQDKKFEYLTYYLAELSLLEYDCLMFLPSLVAASTMFLASFIIWPENHPWFFAFGRHQPCKNALGIHHLSYKNVFLFYMIYTWQEVEGLSKLLGTNTSNISLNVCQTCLRLRIYQVISLKK
ncbi:cyclin-A3-4-like isoform X2 [Lotus japonicus]|uniref:cyclin-A3-4-like isoform X2 n=1 Tax=Lotus japonicus TaxID=34305 RepID=UPI0025867302|nr:cyclin-A3-4-like isoform X2 [Lotus japonicus]